MSFISKIFGSRGDAEVTSDAATRGAINTLISEKQVKSVFQPVVDLKTRRIFSYESLARSQMDAFKSPPAMFEAAIEAGRVGELGRILRAMSVEHCPDTPLFLNINPNEFDEGWLVRPDDPIFRHEEAVYVEITESVPLKFFAQCHSVLAEMRGKGILLAVDDLGAGYSNFKYIADLEPEIVKLDRELIAGVRPGTMLFKLVKSLVRLCHDMGARVVAEGIETKEELEAVIEAGADFGQGYLLARPAFPPPESVWPE